MYKRQGLYYKVVDSDDWLDTDALKKGEKIDKLLFGGYSTISLGYAGLYECCLLYTSRCV